MRLIEEPASKSLWTPDGNPRENKGHRGTVLALGPQAKDGELAGSREVPWGIAVGDTVIFVLAVWLDKMRMSLAMPEIDGPVCIVAQEEIVAVVLVEGAP